MDKSFCLFDLSSELLIFVGQFLSFSDINRFQHTCSLLRSLFSKLSSRLRKIDSANIFIEIKGRPRDGSRFYRETEFPKKTIDKAALNVSDRLLGFYGDPDSLKRPRLFFDDLVSKREYVTVINGKEYNCENFYNLNGKRLAWIRVQTEAEAEMILAGLLESYSPAAMFTTLKTIELQNWLPLLPKSLYEIEIQHWRSYGPRALDFDALYAVLETFQNLKHLQLLGVSSDVRAKFFDNPYIRRLDHLTILMRGSNRNFISDKQLLECTAKSLRLFGRTRNLTENGIQRVLRHWAMQVAGGFTFLEIETGLDVEDFLLGFPVTVERPRKGDYKITRNFDQHCMIFRTKPNRHV